MNCIICEAYFEDVEQYIFHLEYFHNSTSFSCPFQDCQTSFHKRYVLKQHLIRVHKVLTRLKQDTNISEAQKHSENTVSGISSRSDCEKELSLDKESEFSVTNMENRYNAILLNCVEGLVAKLYSNSSIPRSFIQYIISIFTSFLNSEIFEILLQLINHLPENDLLNTITIMIRKFTSCLSHYDTEYKRFKHFKSSDYYVEPIQVEIGVENDRSSKNSYPSLVLKHRTVSLMPIKKQLKLFLELPGVLKTINEFQNSLTKDKSGRLNNIVQAHLWKNITYSNEIVLPLIMYFDDFEIGNPLGSHAGCYKMGAIYYTIGTIPPQFASRLENIFTAMLFHSTDRTSFGNEKMFRALIDQLKLLESEGITLENGTNVKFSVTLVVGDNLGTNSILGFTESFSAHHYCRICIGEKNVMKTQIKEDDDLIRCKRDYEAHCDQNLFGIKEKCIWNELSNFHVYENISCDIMHDLFEGVLRYEMAQVIYNLLEAELFSIETLNSRIKFGIYDSSETNHPPSIKLDHVRNGYITMSSSEMSSLVRNFRFFVGDLVPEGNKAWLFYLKLLEIIEVVMSYSFSEDTLVLLDFLVSEHHEMYMQLFQESLKPKHHFMLHYSRIIRAAGPPRFYSSIRFEAKHKEYKANIVNRKNVPMTLSIRNQMKFCYRLISKVGINDIINIGSVDDFEPNSFEFVEFPGSKDDFYPVTWYEKNGIKYSSGGILYTDISDDIMPVFKGLKCILVHKQNSQICYLLCQSIITKSFNHHYYAYEVEYETTKSVISLSECNYLFPTTMRLMNNGGSYVSLPLH